VISRLPRGPGEPFVPLLDRACDTGAELPAPFREIYGSDWRIPARERPPYVYVNFVVSRDGRVSFNEQGHGGGGDVSGFDRHDRWLMALLRARADAVLVGENTLRVEAEHVWTPEHVFPEDAPAFAELREAEERAAIPLQVFLSQEGLIDPMAAVLHNGDAHVVIATTSYGAARARSLLAGRARVDVLELGVDSVDAVALLRALAEDFAVTTLLCEGGPRVYASLLAAGCVDDEFLTLAPIAIGASATKPRPSLVEGVAFAPQSHPRARLLSVRCAGDHLFIRSRYARRAPT
jgi:riboflavin biosynthesis pyrimidine reductase